MSGSWGQCLHKLELSTNWRSISIKSIGFATFVEFILLRAAVKRHTWSISSMTNLG